MDEKTFAVSEALNHMTGLDHRMRTVLEGMVELIHSHQGQLEDQLLLLQSLSNSQQQLFGLVESPQDTVSSSMATAWDASPMTPTTAPTPESWQSGTPMPGVSPAEPESSCVHRKIQVEGSNNWRPQNSVLETAGRRAQCGDCGVWLRLDWIPVEGVKPGTLTSQKPESQFSATDGWDKRIADLEYNVKMLIRNFEHHITGTEPPVIGYPQSGHTNREFDHGSNKPA